MKTIDLLKYYPFYKVEPFNWNGWIGNNYHSKELVIQVSNDMITLARALINGNWWYLTEIQLMHLLTKGYLFTDNYLYIWK